MLFRGIEDTSTMPIYNVIAGLTRIVGCKFSPDLRENIILFTTQECKLVAKPQLSFAINWRIMQNIPLENLVLIDIETVSCCPEHAEMEDHWKDLWAEKVGRILPENVSAEEFYPQRAAILAEFGKVVCISLGYFKLECNEWQLRIKSIYGTDEKDVLNNFVNTLNQFDSRDPNWGFAGHNIKEFDIPFLCRRMLVNNMPIPRYMNFQNMKPWETMMIDTLQQWKFGDYKNYISLKLLAACLGVPSPKDDIDGSDVGNVYWKDQDLKRIATYCQKDVVTVANIILRFKNMALLNEQQVVYV
jgi:3'-5' exonuclease